MKCPYCDGYGETGFPEATSVDTRSDGYYECSWCNGTGERPDPDHDTEKGGDA